jgi:hypothetical protein
MIILLCTERSRFTESGDNVSGLAGEVKMPLRLEPLLCFRAMQLT